MTNLSDNDMTSHDPTERDDDQDHGGHGGQDTGDEPTEESEDRDVGGEGASDTGDEA